MKTMFNITTSSEDLDRFQTRQDLMELMDGFDGVELMQFEADLKGILPAERVIGLHMSYFPFWLDFWNGNMQAVVKELDSIKNVKQVYGGIDRNAILNRFRKDFEYAHLWDVEYVVFHVSDATIRESFTLDYNHNDEQVIDATIELINELLAEEDGSIAFLVENLWQPGFTFTRPEMTNRLIEGIHYPNKGIMLDTGHILHTNLKLRTQEEGLAYIHAMLDLHGELCKYIRGIHLNQSLTGEYCEEKQKNPPDLSGSYTERYGLMFWHAFEVDKHLPFTCKGIKELISRINPEYLTFEFITENTINHKRYLTAQKKALGMI